MKRLTALLTLFLLGCTIDKDNNKAFVKTIRTAACKIEWYTHKAAFAEFPDVVILERSGSIDTICVTTNLAELNYSNDTIILAFYGHQKNTIETYSYRIH